MKGTLAERFWAKVEKKVQDDCWEWQGTRNNNGYGQIGKGARGSGLLYAHRVSWELASGPIPKGMCVLHHCDNPGCVNPAHLFLGTMADNMRDMVDKGRSARGEGKWSVKLTEQDVHEIRQMLSRGISQMVIAEKYGVTQRTISMIKTGETWGWLK